jgi:hypothetical protein
MLTGRPAGTGLPATRVVRPVRPSPRRRSGWPGQPDGRASAGQATRLRRAAHATGRGAPSDQAAGRRSGWPDACSPGRAHPAGDGEMGTRGRWGRRLVSTSRQVPPDSGTGPVGPRACFARILGQGRDRPDRTCAQSPRAPRRVTSLRDRNLLRSDYTEADSPATHPVDSIEVGNARHAADRQAARTCRIKSAS